MIKSLEHSLSCVFFGVVVGALGSSVLKTNKGQQMLHDLESVADDFVTACEMFLDQNVSYDDSLTSVVGFVESTIGRLEQYDSAVLKDSTPNTENSMPKNNTAHVTGSDDADVILLNKLSKRLYR